MLGGLITGGMSFLGHLIHLTQSALCLAAGQVRRRGHFDQCLTSV
jgi:hypothetical protein